ncbi:hypothetical protein BX666DRAFT_1892634 [Dichotomocladium elegans]|nr:hypothetical protein BX666DRAFT_1892634 [Dichotomocladium elegans]
MITDFPKSHKRFEPGHIRLNTSVPVASTDQESKEGCSPLPPVAHTFFSVLLSTKYSQFVFPFSPSSEKRHHLQQQQQQEHCGSKTDYGANDGSAGPFTRFFIKYFGLSHMNETTRPHTISHWDNDGDAAEYRLSFRWIQPMPLAVIKSEETHSKTKRLSDPIYWHACSIDPYYFNKSQCSTLIQTIIRFQTSCSTMFKPPHIQRMMYITWFLNKKF